MNTNSKKLTIPDLISIGVFTAIYFVLVTVATFACALLPGAGNILLPAVCICFWRQSCKSSAASA